MIFKSANNFTCRIFLGKKVTDLFNNSETGQHWQGEDLWRAIRTIPTAERVQDPVGDSGLPPLYPK
nr:MULTISPECIES: hypothetical protein [unclassified Pseudomonas]